MKRIVFLFIAALFVTCGFAQAQQYRDRYKVKKKDTLYGIASRYGISVNDLKNANNLTSNTLSIGQVLVIPGSNIYTVKSGDTLYSIARNNNVTVDAIKRANNLTSNLLSIGQKLIIP